MIGFSGRFKEARDCIIMFAKTTRHGLIPNLLDGGNRPRFNCRDAAWWFLQCIQDYCLMSEEGMDFLEVIIDRSFPTDDMAKHTGVAVPTKMSAIIQEILQKHVLGISYREWNAGASIDGDMADDGFNVEVRFDAETGFVSGGSANNCGTWMDKMGGSTVAGNKGVPATPRDGADVEIIGMLKSTVRWLSEMSAANKYPHTGVTYNGAVLTFKEWNSKLQASFEQYFWVPEDAARDEAHHCDTKTVHRRGIYKDTVGSSAVYTDYQLRPNLCVAMTVAPELFTKERAQVALEHVEALLVGPLGMRTLDPGDLQVPSSLSVAMHASSQ